MEVLTPAALYSLRETNLIPLPKGIQDVIATIHLAPTAPTFRKTGGARRKHDIDSNWRSRVLVEFHKRIKESDDPAYDECRMTLNKLVKSNVDRVVDVLLKAIVAAGAAAAAAAAGAQEDAAADMFRLRIVNLLFHQGITMPSYSALLADVTKAVIDAHPDAKDDLAANCNMDALNAMFNMSETIPFPSSELPDFEDLVCKWNKQRERRRGFIVFVSDLFVRGLVDMVVMKSAVDMVLPDLESNMRSPATSILTENVDQTITLLFEIMRAVSKSAMGTEIKERIAPILRLPRTEFPCLGMRSRFKMEDILKL
jgi:hypothetical protein